MDIQFDSYLDTAGVTAETKKVLLEQGIVSKMGFFVSARRALQTFTAIGHSRTACSTFKSVGLQHSVEKWLA